MSQGPEFLKPSPIAIVVDDERKRLGYSIRHAADLASISEGRWRQIVKGYQQMAGGIKAPVNAPAETLARMVAAVRINAEGLSNRLGHELADDEMVEAVLKSLRTRSLVAGISYLHGEVGSDQYLSGIEEWLLDLQSRIESLEGEVDDLRSGGEHSIELPDYSQMSEEDVRNYGLAAKQGDKNIGPSDIPHEP